MDILSYIGPIGNLDGLKTIQLIARRKTKVQETRGGFGTSDSRRSCHPFTKTQRNRD